jgi:ABC-type phosphate/phosphonate transport system substrate-binding protein
MKKNILFTLLLFLSIFLPWPSESVEEKKPQTATEYLNIAYLRFSLGDVDTKDAEVAINLWSSEVSKGLKRSLQGKSFFLDDTAAILDGVKAKKFDIIALPTEEYLKLREVIDLEPVLGTVIGGKPGEEYVLITRKDKGGNNLGGLKNLKLFLQKDQWKGNIPLVWLDTILLRQGLPPAKKFFSLIKTVDKPSQAILPVFFRQTDICLVTRRGFATMVELNPQLGAELQTLALSPCFVTGVISFRKDLSPEIKTQTVEAALKLQTHPQGKQILTLFKIDKFFSFKPADLNTLIELMQEYKKLQGGNKS